MIIKDAVKIIETAECAQIATFGKDETEGFPEIRALLNLANPKKYPKLKDKAISVEQRDLIQQVLAEYFHASQQDDKADMKERLDKLIGMARGMSYTHSSSWKNRSKTCLRRLSVSCFTICCHRSTMGRITVWLSLRVAPIYSMH